MEEMTVEEYRRKYKKSPIIKRKRKPPPDWEGYFYAQIKNMGIELPERELAGWHPMKRLGHYMPSRWRFDFALPKIKCCFEIEGGGYVRGKHHRPEGYQKDCIKYNEATLLGWKVFRFTPDMVEAGTALQTYIRVLTTYGGKI